MSKNPSIQFRLPYYQLARGLQAIRAIDQTLHIPTANQLVKTVYLDWCAKMAITRTDTIRQETWDELKQILSSNQFKLTPDLTKQILGTNQPTQPPTPQPARAMPVQPKSVKSVVEDFDPTTLNFDDLPDFVDSDNNTNNSNKGE